MSRTPAHIDKHELGEILGLSPRTIEKWTLQRRLPFIRHSGRCIRYDLDEVLAALEPHRVPVGGTGQASTPAKRRDPDLRQMQRIVRDLQRDGHHGFADELRQAIEAQAVRP